MHQTASLPVQWGHSSLYPMGRNEKPHYPIKGNEARIAGIAAATLGATVSMVFAPWAVAIATGGTLVGASLAGISWAVKGLKEGDQEDQLRLKMQVALVAIGITTTAVGAACALSLTSALISAVVAKSLVAATMNFAMLSLGAGYVLPSLEGLATRVAHLSDEGSRSWIEAISSAFQRSGREWADAVRFSAYALFPVEMKEEELTVGLQLGIPDAIERAISEITDLYQLAGMERDREIARATETRALAYRRLTDFLSVVPEEALHLHGDKLVHLLAHAKRNGLALNGLLSASRRVRDVLNEQAEICVNRAVLLPNQIEDRLGRLRLRFERLQQRMPEEIRSASPDQLRQWNRALNSIDQERDEILASAWDLFRMQEPLALLATEAFDAHFTNGEEVRDQLAGRPFAEFRAEFLSIVKGVEREEGDSSDQVQFVTELRDLHSRVRRALGIVPSEASLPLLLEQMDSVEQLVALGEVLKISEFTTEGFQRALNRVGVRTVEDVRRLEFLRLGGEELLIRLTRHVNSSRPSALTALEESAAELGKPTRERTMLQKVALVAHRVAMGLFTVLPFFVSPVWATIGLALGAGVGAAWNSTPLGGIVQMVKEEYFHPTSKDGGIYSAIWEIVSSALSQRAQLHQDTERQRREEAFVDSSWQGRARILGIEAGLTYFFTRTPTPLHTPLEPLVALWHGPMFQGIATGFYAGQLAAEKFIG